MNVQSRLPTAGEPLERPPASTAAVKTAWGNLADVEFNRMLPVVIRLATLSLTGLLYAATVLAWTGVSGTVLKLVLFVLVATAIPFAAALALQLSRRAAPESAELFLSGCEMMVVAAAILFGGAALLVRLLGLDIATWNTMIVWFLAGLTAGHVALMGGMAAAPQPMRRRSLLAWQKVITLNHSIPELAAVPLVVLAAMPVLFRVGPNNPLLTAGPAGLFALDPRPGWKVIAAALIAPTLLLAATFALLRFEARCAASRPLLLARIERLALAFTLPAVFVWYFDFTFRTDVLHFLANVGPAAQIVHAGSVPMVSAFSQYGPGPLLVTWLGFLAMSPGFQAANVVSQLHSLLFYAVILICLVRMTRHRLPALLLGFAAIGVVLAGWWGGNSSLNILPSSIGLRYLPSALLVLAISSLKNGRAVSWVVLAAVMLSAMWSYETLIGSTAIIGLFLLVFALRTRDAQGLVRDGLLAIALPIAAAMAVTCAMTLLWSGSFPDYRAYLAFALAYNPLSPFWSLTGDGSFLAWIIVAAAGMTALALAWCPALAGRTRDSGWDSSEVLIYRVAPMAGLVAFTNSYFVGRSVDFLLIISFLPLAALVIPAILEVFRLALAGSRAARFLAAAACIAIFLPLTFSVAAVYRAGSPYSIAMQQCIWQGVCSPSGFIDLAQSRYRLRPMIDQPADPNFFEQGSITAEAMSLIERYAPRRERIALFLGIHPATIWSVHTNAVLVLTGRGHRWPLSYVLSDEINPVLRRSIIDADVKLEEGEPVFIRRDESRLGELETALVKKVREEVRLCPLQEAGRMVAAYRATWRPTC